MSQFWSLCDNPSFLEVLNLQRVLVEKRSQDLIPDTFLFLEHPPTFTRGRGLQWTGKDREKQVPFLPVQNGIPFYECERGGDLTYHGPGQWVVYPICKLDGSGLGPHHDVTGFLRFFEQTVINILRDLKVDSSVRENAAGVWVSDQKKIASIGIAVKKWVTFHGLALNVTNDLTPFYQISPCGFQPEVMTRLSDWISLPQNWRSSLENSFIQKIQALTGQTSHLKRVSMAELERLINLSVTAPTIPA